MTSINADDPKLEIWIEAALKYVLNLNLGRTCVKISKNEEDARKPMNIKLRNKNRMLQ